jgi:hypothetical protein
MSNFVYFGKKTYFFEELENLLFFDFHMVLVDYQKGREVKDYQHVVDRDNYESEVSESRHRHQF